MLKKTFEWAQFELKKTETIDTWLDKLKIPTDSYIVEIGAGKGMITQALANRFKMVQAIEIDENNINQLEKLQKTQENIEIIHKDFLKHFIDQEDYHIIANPPFNISRNILDHIISQKHLPMTCHLMLQKELVTKITKKDGEHNSLSAFFNTFYDCTKTSDLKREDFQPKANVSVATFSAYKKDTPQTLTNSKTRKKYMQFIEGIYNKSNQSMKSRLKQYFTNTQIKRLCETNAINPDKDPFLLSSNQWVALFNFREFKQTLGNS